MRRKADRASANKKLKSPDKKVEKIKRTRTRRRKQSSSSDNESVDESSSVIQDIESVDSNGESKDLQTFVKEGNLEETQEQVWQVKTAEGTGDRGEIKKLKICLTRPPSTPEMVDCSPHSKRKHSQTTSSSDTPSIDGGDERKKKKHSKRSNRESKDETDKSFDSHDDSEIDVKKVEDEHAELSQKSNVDNLSITPELNPDCSKDSSSEHLVPHENTDQQFSDPNSHPLSSEISVLHADKSVIMEATVDALPKSQPENECDDLETEKDTAISKESESDFQGKVASDETDPENDHQNQENSENCSSKEQNLEIHNEEVSCNDTKENSENKSPDEAVTEIKASSTHVVDTSESEEKDSREISNDLGKGETIEKDSEKEVQKLERSDSVQPVQEESVQNDAAPIIINRKRRWGSRPSKIKTQKSITISTDILKEIIPDVKPVEFDEIIEERKQHKRVEVPEKVDRPVLPKIVIDNTQHMEHKREHEQVIDKEASKSREANLGVNRKISIVKDGDSIITRPPSPPRHKQSCILFITNLVRPFTLAQLKNLLQRTGRIAEDGFWIDKIKSKCFVKFESEDQAVETRHALHGVTWPVSNPKTLQVDFSSQEAFDKAKLNEEQDNAQVSTVPGTVEDWLREQDMKRERGELEKPWERKTLVREWDVGKNGKEKEKDKFIRDAYPMEKRRHRTPERSPEPVRKFKRKEEEAPAKLLDDLFRKTKSVPCIYWLPLSAETIAVKEEQRRKHMAEHERRMQELRRTHRRH